jgi:hypothetical protein
VVRLTIGIAVYLLLLGVVAFADAVAPSSTVAPQSVAPGLCCTYDWPDCAGWRCCYYRALGAYECSPQDQDYCLPSCAY